jgi:hypothetical protein
MKAQIKRIPSLRSEAKQSRKQRMDCFATVRNDALPPERKGERSSGAAQPPRRPLPILTNACHSERSEEPQGLDAVNLKPVIAKQSNPQTNVWIGCETRTLRVSLPLAMTTPNQTRGLIPLLKSKIVNLNSKIIFF